MRNQLGPGSPFEIVPFGRRSVRLHDYDYSNEGYYFITINADGGRYLFGRIVGDQMYPSPLGRCIQETWEDLPHKHDGVDLDAFVVMPNHMNGILVLYRDVTEGKLGPRTPIEACADDTSAKLSTRWVGSFGARPKQRQKGASLGEVVRAFKARVCVKWRKESGLGEFKVWHRNYYEHVIRNEESLNQVREYIINNLMRWALDCEYRGSGNP